MHQEPIPRVRAQADHRRDVCGVDAPRRNTRTHPLPDQVKGAIVVVDDDDSIWRAAQRMLNAAGFRAETFASAESLLESDAAHRAACLVLDIHLPGLSGFELCRELVRSGFRQPPVIFITGQTFVARAQAEALGAAAYLPKPFAGRALVAAVTGAVVGVGRP
jgi:two-component system response regulator FixJ